jgi:beta-galactosidase
VVVPANSTAAVPVSQILISPAAGKSMVELWSPDSPAVYTATASVSSTTTTGTTDNVTSTFGIRSFSFSAEQGLVLNGERLWLYGGCVHHDNGPLGSRTFDRAEERRVQLLKAQGYNAIRTSHNPVSPAFLDACDRLGVVVMDEVCVRVCE